MSIFTKPYPKDADFKKRIFTCIILGNFVFLFLFLFQPFGINDWDISYKALRLMGYGLITAVVVLLNGVVIENLFKKWFIEKNWKVWKEILWASWNILVIGSFNLLYSHWLIGFELSFFNFLLYQWITLLIGLFPVTMLTLYNYNRLQSKNLKQATEINQVIESEPAVSPTNHLNPTITLVGENAREILELQIENLLYIESADNYAEVVWEANGSIQKKLLRNTLKNFEEKLSDYPYIFRCHRSYMVNLNKVIKVSGNSQGYKLHLLNTDEQIPVSRSLNESIREKIESIHTKTA